VHSLPQIVHLGWWLPLDIPVDVNVAAAIGSSQSVVRLHYYPGAVVLASALLLNSCNACDSQVAALPLPLLSADQICL
jgi:hypothetical protein